MKLSEMRQKVSELREKREKLVTDQRAMIDKADAEDRSLNADETQTYENMEKDFDKYDEEIHGLLSEIDRRHKLEEKETRMRESQRLPSLNDPGEPPAAKKPEDRKVHWRDSEEYAKAFNRALMYGMKSMPEEFRALQLDDDTYGGYLAAPTEWINTLIKAVDAQVFMQQLATVYTVADGTSLGAPALDNDPADPTWTVEIAVGSEDSTMSFGGRQLTPHPLAQYIKVSKTLLRRASQSADAIVRDRLAYKIAYVAENGYLNGTGDNSPLGVFVASAQGINTDRDASSGNSNTAIGADGLIEAKYTLKAQYHQNARWLFHRDAIKMIRKLKDGSGDYLWRTGISSDRPDTILDTPFFMSELAPNTFTSGLYVGIIGDFRHYWIAIAMNMAIEVLTELYAESNQVGYISRFEADGMPVLSEAFVRVTLT